MFPSLHNMETQHSICVPRVCAPKKHHQQQCVRNNVSSFARAFTEVIVYFLIDLVNHLKQKKLFVLSFLYYVIRAKLGGRLK